MMRGYATLSPAFWTGATGREVKRHGPEAVVVALYLVTSPHSNMLGLFYQPRLYLAHETGLPIEGASKGLQSCIEAGFCSFDEPSETVWVHEMAAHQVGRRLSPNDKRCAGIRKLYAGLPKSPFLGPFFDRYAADFHLGDRRGMEGASETHRSQEQEQEQKIPFQEGETVREAPASTHARASRALLRTIAGAGR